jgi:hypothetical protein
MEFILITVNEVWVVSGSVRSYRGRRQDKKYETKKDGAQATGNIETGGDKHNQFILNLVQNTKVLFQITGMNPKESCGVLHPAYAG